MMASSPESCACEGASFSDRVLKWHDDHGRSDLPWQKDISAYRVWVSEIMLQQTQVSTVIDYFNRFMSAFPSIADLAAAPQDQVLKYWSGLGYYARARNLHKTAQMIQSEYQGVFPTNLESVMDLPGIGRSTAGAILSIVYNQPHAILDGNVKRVLARYYAIESWTGHASVQRTLWQHAQALTPKSRVGQYTQAMMDLGATLCTRTRPQCEVCPILAECEAYKQNKTHALPVSKPKKDKPTKTIRMWVVFNRLGQVLLEKRPSQGIWGGLLSLPEQSTDENKDKWLNELMPEVQGELVYQALEAFRHTFSHYHLDIFPIKVVLVESPKLKSRYEWHDVDEIEGGVPAPVAKILSQAVI